MRQEFRELLFSHHPPLFLFLLSILLPCIFYTWGDRAGLSLVLWSLCHWEAAQGSCCSSALFWEPCLKIWICFPKVRRSYHWLHLQFPQPLLSCEIQDFLHWPWSLTISGTSFRKASSLCISFFSSLCHTFLGEFLNFWSLSLMKFYPCNHRGLLWVWPGCHKQIQVKNKESHHTMCLLNESTVWESQKDNVMKRN